MKPVFQTKFGGPDAPLLEQGNCLQACLASMLEIPLERAFDCRPYGDDHWAEAMNDWMNHLGLHIVTVKYSPIFRYPGYTLLGGTHRPTGIPHVVVCRDGEFVHDPIPGGSGDVEPEVVWLFVALDPKGGYPNHAAVW